jgi:uncharacterized coiled-coil protein SlyX
MQPKTQPPRQRTVAECEAQIARLKRTVATQDRLLAQLTEVLTIEDVPSENVVRVARSLLGEA